MSQNESKPEPDPLSATAMFLRALEPKSELAGSGSEHSARTPAAGDAGAANAVPAAPPVAAPAAGPPSMPGEFTRLFQPRAEEEAAVPEPTGSVSSEQDQLHARKNSEEPGEFTRIFLSKPARAAATGRTPDDGQRTRNGPARAKGFSSPGASDSASAEGSVTQLYHSVGPVSAPPPGSPATAPEPLATTGRDSSSPPRITELIESLASPAASPREAKTAWEPPAPADPLPPAASRISDGGSQVSGGVTQLIQKLADESAQGPASSPAPKAPVSEASRPLPPAAETGPGEYTRVIARIEEPAAAPIPPAASPASTAPRAAAATPLPAVRMPAAPKVAAPPAPTVAPPKTKVEAMVPALLVVNTVLLVAVLAVLMLLLHAK